MIAQKNSKKSAVFGLLFPICILSLVSSMMGCETLGTYNPATGRREFIMVTTPSEVAMGENVHQSIAREYKLAEDNDQLKRVQRIGDRLSKVSDRQDYRYNFFLIERDEMNAFTTPGGNIYIYTGLLERLQTDDQIASVLAHEMGHCAARHTVKKFQAALSYNIISNLIISQVEQDNSKRVAAISTNTLMSLIFASYSRKDEFEADRLGIKYLYLACFAPYASVETLEILKENSKDPETLLMLRSHPFVTDRVREARWETQSVAERYGSVSCL